MITKLIEDGHHVFGLVRSPISYFNSVYYTNVLIDDISSNIDFDENLNIDIKSCSEIDLNSNSYKEYYDVNVLGLKSILNYR